MTLDLQIPQVGDLRPRITVFGVGGAGCNAVSNMIAKELEGVNFVVANTDAQSLKISTAPTKIQLGEKITEGLGAGAQPAVGAKATEESLDVIIDELSGSHMCFITAGMGGGTGTGAAPIIAQAARQLGILTVGVITTPFEFEGNKRSLQADEGVEALSDVVDTLIIIPNQNLFRVVDEKTTFTDAFSKADDVLYQGVKGVTDLIVRPGMINLDFADIRAVMNEMGKAMMGTGEAEGEGRASKAAENAINNQLLDEISLDGARGVLINITGGRDITLFEVDEAANLIRNRVDPDANILVGTAFDDTMEGWMRISVVATGIDVKQGVSDVPRPRRSLKAPLPLQPNEPAPEELNLEQDEELFDEPTSHPSEMPSDMHEEAVAFHSAPQPESENAETEDATPHLFDEFERENPFYDVSDVASTTQEGRFDHDRMAPRLTGFGNIKPTYPTDTMADEAFEPTAEVAARLAAAVNKIPTQQSGTPQSAARNVENQNQAHGAKSSSTKNILMSIFKRNDDSESDGENGHTDVASRHTDNVSHRVEPIVSESRYDALSNMGDAELAVPPFLRQRYAN